MISSSLILRVTMVTKSCGCPTCNLCQCGTHKCQKKSLPKQRHYEPDALKSSYQSNYTPKPVVATRVTKPAWSQNTQIPETKPFYDQTTTKVKKKYKNTIYF